MMFEGIRDSPEMVSQHFLDNGFVMAGTPDDCCQIVEAFAEAGVDQLIVHMQMGGIGHDRIAESIELFASEVMPNFR